MANRIVITHKCAHAGKHLPDVVDKFWDTTPKDVTRVCYCLPDPEKVGQQLPTPMIHTITMAEVKPE